MTIFQNFDLQTLGLYVLLCMGFAFVLAGLLLVVVERQMRKINVPDGADFTTTLQYTPFLLVVVIDLLDLALDVFAFPIVWVVLNRMGLNSLRNVSTVEALIPFTGPIPTMTICWLAVNVLNIRL